MLARSIWAEPAPDIGTHIPGGAFGLDVTPPPRFPIGLSDTRGIHGLVTALTDLPHHPTVPMFALAPWSGGVGWAVHVAVDEAARRLAGRTHHGHHLFGRPVDVRCGPLMRLRAPDVGAPGMREIVLRTVTPIVIRGNGRINDTGRHGAGTRHRRVRVDGGALTSTLCAWLPRRVGLRSDPHMARVEVYRERGGRRRVRVGGRLGVVEGWTGEMGIRANAYGHWLLALAALLGLGARVAFGFGRVTVERC